MNGNLNPTQQPGEESIELSLRPRRLSEFVGQRQIRENLSVYLQAAQKRGEPLDHLLLYGPPGLGKTTLAHIVGAEMGVGVHITSGPAIVRAGDLAGILTNLEPGEVLFIDEIHRLPRPVEEILYPAMEDRKVDVMLGSGPAARSIRLEIPPITVIGATTRQGMLSGPLRHRFGIDFHLEFYAADDLQRILIRSAALLGYDLADDGAEEIARRSRGTPRIANRLLRRVRDFAQVAEEGTITQSLTQHALGQLQVDLAGLDRVDQLYLRTIIDKFSGGPVGIETIAASLGEDTGTLEDVCEPYLLQKGFIMRTPRGRTATTLAYDHLGLTPPSNGQLPL
ncbi:MAG: Holliday junction branch migration DNA helicase RuvB [Fimbriimonadaceae bacterium]|nr:Holliday junction branch migration DNA helicase RuvB [Fimbriimonadaceae bacterium]